MSAEQFDVIVVGGGMVGAAMAVGLDQQGLRVALVEQRKPETFNAAADYDLRVSAISPASQLLLKGLGVWQLIQQERHCQYSDMHVWEDDSEYGLHFSAAELEKDSLGAIVENNLILHALWQRLGDTQLFCPQKVAELEIDGQRARVCLASGEMLDAPLVVAADGGRSQVRSLAGIQTFGWAYQQKGIVAVVTTESPHKNTAWQRFLSSGPIAFLPLDDGRCSIVWSADDRLAEELLQLGDQQFCEALSASSQRALGGVTGTGPRAAFPLHFQQAEQYIRPRLALVGDAAHVVHPLAGQGVNLGFGDVELLTRLLVSANHAGRDLGSHKTLRRYERARKAEDALMAQMTDRLSQVYRMDGQLHNFGRQQGLRAVNLLKPIKNALATQALG